MSKLLACRLGRRERYIAVKKLIIIEASNNRTSLGLP
jgi:hypothetical protein